jgi:REP element-mobilizing transposase RayT
MRDTNAGCVEIEETSRVTRNRTQAGVGTPALHKRRHLRRLKQIFDTSRSPLFFLTVCMQGRRPLLDNPAVVQVLVQAWEEAEAVHGWMVGRYVVMPDHVHFFAAPSTETAKTLSGFIECWKRWTRRHIRNCGSPSFAWQAEFFDHLMRSTESYAQKWEYVRFNPVRSGLVAEADDWPHQGEIHSLRW